jgi:hypothetical protein
MEGISGEICFMSDIMRNESEIIFPGYELHHSKGAIKILKLENTFYGKRDMKHGFYSNKRPVWKQNNVQEDI